MMDMMEMMRRMPKKGVKPEDLPDAGSEDARVYTEFCSMCHPLPNPRMHSAKEWKAVVARMIPRIQMMGTMMEGSEGSGGMMMNARPMTREEIHAVLRYLEEHGLTALSEGDIRGLTTKDAETFKEVCSRCHDLPDPKQFTQEEWPGIVAAMKENMMDMEVPLPSPEEEEQILQFLRESSRSG
jgi:cytochrome c5